MSPLVQIHSFSRIALILLVLSCFSLPPHIDAAQGARFAVATVHPIASTAALDIFDQGGNAVDAAIAAALMLGVVDGHNSGIGGGCFILIRDASGGITCIDGRETAPAAAHREMFIFNGRANEEASRTGPLAVAVPGALKAYEMALQKHGKMRLATLLAPAATVAANGFAIDSVLAGRIAANAPKLALFASSKAVFLHADGSPMKAGETLVQKDLAATYRSIAAAGTAWFYEGPFAKSTSEWMRAHGGLLSEQDFRDYKIHERQPLRTFYREYEIIGMPPPSSGGVHVAQILQMCRHLGTAGKSPAARIHWMAEAMKLAFADRAHWLGDPDFVRVPKGIVDSTYTDSLAARIQPERILQVDRHGIPPNWEGDVFGKHTTHLCTADAEGNWVAITQTINTAFGSKVVIPGTGVLLNNEMDDFSIQPGVPNAFGLVGTEANAVAGRKRPLSSMSPTLVLKEGRPVLGTGAAGGPTIITQVATLLTGILDAGLSPSEALQQTRFHHQWKPDQLRVEESVDAETLRALEAMGHPVKTVGRFGACQVIVQDSKTGLFQAEHDPRVPGLAAGR